MKRLERGLLPQDPPKRVRDEEHEIATKLQDSYRMLLKEASHQPSALQPGAEWIHHRERIFPLELLSNESSANELALYLRDFWRNATGPLVKQYASFSELMASRDVRLKYTRKFAYDLMVWSNLGNFSALDCQLPMIGNPWGYYWEGTLIGSKCLRQHLLAEQIGELVRGEVSPIIMELGGGYGGTGYFISRKVQNATYVNFDLPETLMIAAYYLHFSLPEKRVYLHAGGEFDFESIIKNHDIILLPNWSITSIPDRAANVFLNTFSLSEVGQLALDLYVREIQRVSNTYFLHNNMDRQGVSNAGSLRIPASHYPMSSDLFRLVYKRFDLFQERHFGAHGDYREYLYERLDG